VLLKDAIAPNLVQTLEGTPAFVHGGPFGNIAHGCNSVMATRTALRLADWVVTEAGFGADLGAEKFVDIKCRSAGLAPCASVVVATVRALKYHGGVELPDLAREDVAAVARGAANLERHVRSVRDVYGLPCAVALNHFVQDAPAEIEWLQRWGAEHGVPVVVARHWAEGGQGAEALAREVVRLGTAATAPTSQRFVYDLQAPLADKLRTIAQRVYGAADVALPDAVRQRLGELERQGHGELPVCVAKTQYSFSADPKQRGAVSGHVLPVREVRLAAGAGFVVMVCGDMMTMPGLPKVSAAERIDLDETGRIVGLD
jgi:formate--tetrahydrofolate ligase